MKTLFALLLTLVLFFSSSFVFAENSLDSIENPTHTKIVHKFVRGLANILTSPGEIIKQPLIESDKADSLVGVSAGCITGFFTGIGWMFYRMGTGFIDLLTFPAPINEYESIIDPEFII